MIFSKRIKTNRLVILFLSTFFFLNFIQAQRNYYFNSKAMNEGDGTKQQPFQSLEKLAHLTLHTGDSIFFHSGDTLDGNIALININGTKQNPIVFTSYGNEKQKCVINAKNKEAFIINSSGYFNISNLVFLGGGRITGKTTNGLKLINCNNAKIKNVEVSGFQKSGVIFYNCQSSEINNVYAHENGFAGILVEGEYQKRISNNIHIVNCRADNNPGDPTNHDNHSGNGILVGNCKNILIEYCRATNNGWDMPRIGNGPVGIWAYEADSVTIQHCISYRN